MATMMRTLGEDTSSPAIASCTVSPSIRARRADDAQATGARADIVEDLHSFEGAHRTPGHAPAANGLETKAELLSRIICPSGHRLEGLTVHDALAVLRALA
jgi:hypothetical protein